MNGWEGMEGGDTNDKKNIYIYECTQIYTAYRQEQKGVGRGLWALCGAPAEPYTGDQKVNQRQ